MSRGPGALQRQILATVAAWPESGGDPRHLDSGYLADLVVGKNGSKQDPIGTRRRAFYRALASLISSGRLTESRTETITVTYGPRIIELPDEEGS